MDPIRFIVKRIIPRYIKLMSLSSRVYYSKRSAVYLMLTFHENNQIEKAAKAGNDVAREISHQISLVKKVKAEILLFRKNRARVEAFMQKHGGKELVQYIEFHSQALSKIYEIINRGMYVLALEKKNLNNKRFDLFVRNFKDELRMYNAVNKVLDQNFEVIEGLLGHEYRNNDFIPEEIKEVSGIGSEISRLKKTRRFFPPLMRAMAASALFLMVVLLAEPGKVYNDVIKKASEKPAIAEMVKKYPKEKGLSEMNLMYSEAEKEIRMLQDKIAKTKQDASMSEEEKAKHIASLKSMIDDWEFLRSGVEAFAEIAGKMKKMDAQLKKDLAAADSLLGEVDKKMSDMESKWNRYAASKKSGEAINFEDILNE